MSTARFLLGLLGVVVAALPAWAADGVPEGHVAIEAPSFEGAVLPVLVRRCTRCHGEGGKKKGDLDLTTLQGALAGGSEGPAIAFGDLSASTLWRQIDKAEMPPPDEPALTPTERAILRAFVTHGSAPALATGLRAAPDAISERERAFWSFTPPVRPPIPAVRGAQRVRTPIDAFLLSALEASGLTFNEDAERRTLIRRLSFDLLGLPPSVEELVAFERDPRPTDEAYARLVDRMLTSPHYGERWGRHWLDVAGYAESALYLGDKARPGFWRYRDYVIRAFNADKPFDQFVREQLAGDELVTWRGLPMLDPEIEGTLAATGFLRAAPDGTDNQKIAQRDKRFMALQGAVEISMKALMGLTLNCVRCHSHKFDPIPHEDYYKLVAIFQPAYDPENWLAGNYYPGTKGAVRRVANALPEEQAAYEERQRLRAAEMTRLERERGAMSMPRETRSGPGTVSSLATIERKLERITRARDEDELPWIWALWDASTTPSPTKLLRRGDIDSPGPVVSPGVPAVLDRPENRFVLPSQPPNSSTTGRRLALARWLTSPRHPLMARVFVNRVWQHHFGQGIVATPDDFGARGSRPTHPELLDFLAADFVEGGFGVKRLHRQMLLSTAYRQSARADGGKASADPANRLLARMVPRRLEAEAIRDALLAVSGDLNLSLHGKSVAIALTDDRQFAPRSDDPGRFRRSVYLQPRRSAMPTFLAAFDAPAMETNMPVRARSVLPQQALAIMNSDFVNERSARLAARVLRETEPAGRLHRLFLLTLGRPPRPEEQARIRRFLGAAVARPLARDGTAPEAWQQVCHALLSTNEFLYVE